jgi:hypothetical protein
LQALGIETDDDVEVLFPVKYERKFNERILTRFKEHGVSLKKPTTATREGEV